MVQAVNVSSVERVASSVIGGVLLAAGPGERASTRALSRLLGGALLARGLSGKCPLYQALGMDTGSGAERWRAGFLASGPLEIRRSLPINKSREELYRFWRDPHHLKAVFESFAEVTVSDGVMHWRIHGPLRRKLEFDTRVIEDAVPERVCWHTADDSEVSHEAEVSFVPAPAGWGTTMTLRMRFDAAPPLSDSHIVRMIPKAALGHALRRAKSLIETGEVPTTAPNPAARHGGYGL